MKKNQIRKETRKKERKREDLKMERLYSKEASQFIEAIKTIANKPENMENLESYLSIHFANWINKFASSPEDLVCEIQEFANMII